MFNAISWSAFLTGVALIAGAYYLLTTLLLYYSEIKIWFARRSRRVEAPSVTSPVMGEAEASPPIVLKRATSRGEDLVIGVSEEPGEQIGAVEPPQAKTSWQEIDTLLDEVRTVLATVADAGSDRTECALLMSALLGRYPHLKETSYRDSVAFYVLQLTRESISYELSLQEVLSWWEGR